MRWNQLINIVFFFIFFCFTYSAFAQQLQDSLLFSVPTKNIKHGLDENTLPIFFHKLGSEEDAPNEIQGVLKDKKGFLWINAISGIYRYDGIYFKKIETESVGIEGFSTFGAKIFKFNKSGLWTISGNLQLLYRYNETTEIFENLPILPDADSKEARPVLIRCVLEDRRGLIWISTIFHGLNILDPLTGQLSQKEVYEHLPEDFTMIEELMEDRAGNIWGVGPHLFCLSFQKGTEQIKEVVQYPELVSRFSSGEKKVKYLAEDVNGIIWAAFYEGEVFRLHPQNRNIQHFTNKQINIPEGAEKKAAHIKKLSFTANGKLWIANNLKGISIFDPRTTTFTNYRLNELDKLSLRDNNVTDIYQDETGMIWLGTGTGGINYYYPNAASFGHFRAIPNEAKTLSSNFVQAFFEDSQHNIWIGTRNGLNKYNRQTGQFDCYYPPDSFFKLKKYNIISLNGLSHSSPHFKGNILVGTWEGLLTFNPENGQFSKWQAPDALSKPLQECSIRNLVKDNNGVIWSIAFLSNERHILKYDETVQNFRPFELRRSDGSILVADEVILDAQQRCWVYSGIEDAIYLFDLNTEELVLLKVRPNEFGPFSPTTLNTAWKDAQNRYWVGGSSLFLLTPVEDNPSEYTFENLSKAGGFDAGVFVGMLGDDNQQIWISTTNGMIKANTATLKVQHYRPSDGIQSTSFVDEAYYKSPSSDELYFGGNYGFNVFKPEKIQKDTFAPPLEITNVQVFRDSMMQRIRVENSETSPEISLFHEDKLLQISYAALHYVAPERNQYAIQLKGYDSDWRYVGNQSEATYTNLDGGDYLFRVKASNKDGVWNEVGTSMKVTVHPPWWATWWAYLSYFVIGMVLLYYLYRFQLHRQQEQAEAKRLKEMDEMKSRFFANISHELRTPLTLLLGPVHSVLKRNKLDNRDFTFLKLAQQSGQQLHRLINSILDFSRLEAKTLELHPLPIAFYPFIRRVVSQFESNAQIQGIELDFEYLSDPHLQLQLDKEKFEIIINNLLSNALKFTPKGGKIEVQIQDLQNHLQVQVTDTGRGIHPKDLPHIFNRFYQTKEMADKIEGGSGIGLSLSREYALLFNGELRAESELGEGSTFYFTFPKIEVLGAIAQEEVIEKQETSIALLNALNKNKAISSPSKKTKLQILLVEDNYSLRTYIEFLLQEEYGVKTAENGKIALEYLSNNANDADFQLPDLIISDVMMPIMDGFVLLETLKTNKDWRQIPVIMLTARAELRDKLKALRIGVDDYLVKPFEEAELMARISNLLQHYQERKLAIEAPISADEQASLEEEIKPDWLPMLEQIIEQELGNSNFSIDDIPPQLAMSRSQFFRAMKAAIGLTPNQYLREMRLQKARQLIENKSYRTVKEIAYQVGFQKTSYFSTLFKNRFGKTPSAYMEKY